MHTRHKNLQIDAVGFECVLCKINGENQKKMLCRKDWEHESWHPEEFRYLPVKTNP